MKILAIDPAGNKGKEGNGITGLAIFENGELKVPTIVRADAYKSVEQYWENVAAYMDMGGLNAVVCESYKLQAGKQAAQTWSELMTPQLIGYLRMEAHVLGIPFYFQDPSIKPRWSDEILERMGIIKRLDRTKKWWYGDAVILDHARDAIRHGLHFLKYGAGAKM